MHEIALHRLSGRRVARDASARRSTTIIYAPLDQPNDKLLALLFAAEALRRNGAKRLVLVAPYLCYMRQDAAFHQGEAISQKVIGQLLAGIFDRVDHGRRPSPPHHQHRRRLSRYRSRQPVGHAGHCRSFAQTDRPSTIVVGPDAESRPWVSDLAAGSVSTCGCAENRRGDRSVEIAFADPRCRRPPGSAGRRYRLFRRHA